MHPTYLALGDSYTIGESVPLHEGFPYQLVQKLRAKHPGFMAPEIVAKTGWTTNELATHLIHTVLQKQYDFVTLLIGVNNQYRNLSITEFDQEFTFLLLKSLQYNGHQNNRVFVLSIPDWSHTSFAQKKSAESGLNLIEMSVQIDAFNEVIKKRCEDMEIDFIYITELTRNCGSEMMAQDGLHYSAKMHQIWAGLLLEKFTL
jgi:lysophospholipase L1-like esterase